MMLTLLLIGMLILTFNIQPVEATETIYIRADGSIEPSTANITSVDNITYTFIDNINESIVVERNNIVVDGAGYTVQGTGSGYGIYLASINNVTIKNVEIKIFAYGIRIDYSSNNTISGNNITNNNYGIEVDSSSNNLIYHNNFMNNTYQAFPIGSSYNVWDDGYPSGGNYWSHYVDVDHYSGPYQNETGSDGIWDHPYVIDENNQDAYPLTRPYGREPEFNFIAYGDTRGEQLPWDAVSPLHEEIVNEYLQHDPDFIIHTGDMVSAGGLWYQWVEFNESIAAVREAGVPFYGVVGNHDKYTDQWYVYDEEFINYRTYFDFTHVIDEPGENELYYSFDYEGVHFVFLNTEDYFDDREDGSNEFNCSAAQMDWLIADLSKTHPHDFIVVALHRTAWSIREDRPDRWLEAETVRDDFHDIFIQNGVDLVLMGHDHYYYHTIRDGIHYVTTAGGGAPLAGIDPDPPTWQEGDIAYSVYHYCHIEVNRTHITVTALTPDDTALESFAIARARDTTPPNITGVSQIPLENNVQPDDEVIVNATVIDVVGGVERVALNYTNGNGTWVIIEMTSLSVHPNVWSAIIPSFPYDTNVTYIVIAEDDAGNTITSEELGYECQYQVIPEFTSFLIPSLLMIVTLLAVIVYAKKSKRNLKIIS